MAVSKEVLEIAKIKNKDSDYGGNENMLISAYHSQDPFFPQSDCYNSCLVDFELYDGDPIPDDVEKEPVMWTEA